MKTIGSLAVMDEGFQKYLVNFHIAWDAWRRNLLAPEEIMNTLFTLKNERFPSERYAQGAEVGKASLEGLMQRALIDLAKGGVKKTVTIIGSGEEKDYEVISYDRDPRSQILYVVTGSELKEFSSFWIKSLEAVSEQNETGHLDHQRFRIIVEHPDARKYRTQRPYERLSPAEKKSYDRDLRRQKFHNKKFSNLSDVERDQFYRTFASEYWGLTEAEQREYRKRFSGMNREICRSIAGKISSMSGFDTVPINPHYMRMGNLELRVQRQEVIDNEGSQVLEIEYFLRTRPDGKNNFFGELLSSASESVLSNRNGSSSYLDANGTQCYLVDLGNDLVINFRIHMPNAVGHSPAKINLSNVIRTIVENHESATGRFSDKESGKRETKILEAIRLGPWELMPKVSLGYFIYAETTTTDFENKFAGKMGIDSAQGFVTFVKDKLGEKAEANGFENVKFYICGSGQYKPFSGEFQVMDPAMFYEAEFGKAAKTADKIYWLAEKARRSSKKFIPITKDDESFGRAFFGDGPDSKSHFLRIYAEYYGLSIRRAAENAAQTGGTGDEKSLDLSLMDIRRLYLTARERVGTDNLERVILEIDSIMPVYLEKQGMSVIGHLSPARTINTALRQASSDLNANLVIIDENRLEASLYERHINLLYQAYVRLASAGDVENLVASLMVGRLIRSYHRYFGNALPRDKQDHYARMVENFGSGQGWKKEKIGKKELGYVPKKIPKDKFLDVIKRGPNYRPQGQFRDFDERTATEITKVWETFQ